VEATPAHRTVGVEVTDKLGCAVVSIATVAVTIGQSAFWLLTVYTVLAVGVTVAMEPVCAVFQVKVELLLYAYKLVVAPAHNTLGTATAVMVEKGTTRIGMVSFFTQPSALVMVTE
jgi:hypothetical protein